MVLDLAKYFERVAYRGDTAPTLAVLQALVTAHTRAIPFENLDPLLGVPVDDLGPSALVDKLVNRRRGGYCYEQNGLMGYVLTELGYGVQRLAGRVIWMLDGDAPLPAQTHTVLAVTIPDTEGAYLVDVGFGGQTPTSPLRLESGIVQQTSHEPYRLDDRGEGWILRALVRGEWQALYQLTTRPQPLIDLTVGSWYVSTHPSSIFVTGLTVALVIEGDRWNLNGRDLSIYRQGQTQKKQFDDAAAVVEVLAGAFGVNVADLGERSTLEARIDEACFPS
jgi:arylamine N-acetyltransferase